jgi:sialic acid synthase SpsE
MTVKLIAEFCQNHNGNYDLLAKMVESAAKSGATYGKMQMIYADTLAFRPEFEEGLVQNGVIKAIKRPYITEKKRLKTLEIDENKTSQFVKLCLDNGLIPMTTCFARAHIKSIREAGLKSIKIASYDCASFHMLRELKNNFDEIIISTGATFDDEIDQACKILEGINFSILHCVTIYPTPLNQVHLARMEYLRKFNSNIGFSDHSLVSETGLIASKAALALGATLIERHFTLLKPNQTKDGPVSIGPEEMTELSNFASLSVEERLERMDIEHPSWRITNGQKNRRLSEQELLNRAYYRGRFASPRPESLNGSRMIFNWEETKIV